LGVLGLDQMIECQIILCSFSPSFFLDEKERKNQDKNMLQRTSSSGPHSFLPAGRFVLLPTLTDQDFIWI
tara:strand:- start:191305 stop:191514 length:210 start_codon:yes stop_codon:yes gene_type:complete